MHPELSDLTEPAIAPPVRRSRALGLAALALALLALVALLAPAGASATSYANFNRETYLYSSQLSIAQEASSYQVMVLQSTDAALVPQLKAANPNLKIFVYQAIMAAEDTNSTAMTCTAGPADLASHPSWVLADQNGNPILNASQHHYLTDVGNPGYQQACVANAIATAKAGGFDGVFWDMINESLLWTLPTGVTVPEYPTNAAWQAAMYSMLQYAGAQLHANGLRTIGNMGGAYLTPGLWQQWNGPLDGAEEESFTDAGSGLAASVWAWPRILADAAWSEANGKITVLHSWNSTHAGNVYGLASMMLIAGGESSYATSNGCYAACETWYPEYATAQQLGAPLGPYSLLPGGAYARMYQNGLVVVNPTSSAISSLSLGGGTYTGSGLTSVSSVSLAPTSGYILLRDAGSVSSPGPAGTPTPPPPPAPTPSTPPVAVPARVVPPAPVPSPSPGSPLAPGAHSSAGQTPVDLPGIERGLRRSLAGIQTFNPATPLLSLPCPRALTGPCAYRITLFSITASSSGARKAKATRVIGLGSATLRRGRAGILKVRILSGRRRTLHPGERLRLRITVALRYRGRVEYVTVIGTVTVPRASTTHKRMSRVRTSSR